MTGACRTFLDVERGVRAATAAFALDLYNPFIYVLLANLYAAVGQYSDADRLRDLMDKRGIKKTAGMTWIEINGEVTSFVAHDKLKHVPRYKQQIVEKVRNYCTILSLED